VKATLTYHSIEESGSPISVSPSVFASHLRWLGSARVRVFSLDALASHSDDAGDAVAVTFDDGFLNDLEHLVARGAAVEAAGQPAAAEKVAELLLNETGQAVPIAETRGLRANGLEMILHDLVEHTPGGTPRFVACGRQGHAPR